MRPPEEFTNLAEASSRETRIGKSLMIGLS
jgi:hypothetical protein